MHAANDKIMGYIHNIRSALAYVKGVAEQLPKRTPWQAFVEYVLRKMQLYRNELSHINTLALFHVEQWH